MTRPSWEDPSLRCRALDQMHDTNKTSTFCRTFSRQTLAPWVAKNPEIEPTRQLPLEYINPSICLFGSHSQTFSEETKSDHTHDTPLLRKHPSCPYLHRHTAFSIQSPSSCTAREACYVHSISKPSNVHDLFCIAPSTCSSSDSPIEISSSTLARGLTQRCHQLPRYRPSVSPHPFSLHATCRNLRVPTLLVASEIGVVVPDRNREYVCAPSW